MHSAPLALPCRSTPILVILSLLAPVAARAQVEIDSNTFGGLEARAIGPAVMSGRVSAIDVTDRGRTIYVGTAGGGVWKSKDGGNTFKSVFDDHNQVIGAVRVDPNDPQTVWVGTGESWQRRGVAIGDGIYRTSDGGDTWTNMGLADSGRFARIRVSPADSQTVYACVTGPIWGATEERGLYRTTDGGASWQPLLHLDATTGCADVDLDPQRPEVVYAAMWEFWHGGDFFRSGGPGSGLYRSTDGGDTWTELTAGLPEGEKGRIAVAVAPSRPNVVYALVEGKPTALFRSENLGVSWKKVNQSLNLGYFPFFLAHVVVDPTDFNRVYKPGLTLTVSNDGGESFSSALAGALGSAIHPDHHALWINPEDPKHLVLGTDGGVYVSGDRAASFRHVGSIPVSQFYRVSYDMEFPYNVYGGLQDNGAWAGPSRSRGGIESRDWDDVGFGDGFWVLRDLSDPRYLYYDWQRGNILRVDLVTREARDIRPHPSPGEDAYRWHWNTPLHLSPNEPGTLYAGAQYVFRSRDRGASWERISPDLTRGAPQRADGETNDRGATVYDINFGCVYFIAESPLDAKVIWTGSDDGLVQVTRDGGESWTEVSAHLPEAPPVRWITSVEASPHDAATAFVTVQGHRSDDPAPYLYVTRDHGATWENLVGDDVVSHAYVVRQDPVVADLLYLGTEFGLYISVDGGRNWARFAGNLPKVAIRDLAVHPREHDLIIGTHGRGIYILDDLTPLRQLTAEILESDVALLGSRSAVLLAPALGQSFAGSDQFVGVNPPEAVWISYYLKKRHLFGDLRVEVYDDDGELIATTTGGKRRGLNRAAWALRLPPPKLPPAAALTRAFQGPRAPEGTYNVKLVKGKKTLTGQVELVPDPRSPHSAEDRALQNEVSLELYDHLEDLTYVAEAAAETRDQARERVESLRESDRTRRRAEELADALDSLLDVLVSKEAGFVTLSGERLREKMAELYGNVLGYTGRPTETQLDRLEAYKAELAQARERFEAVRPEVAQVNRMLERKGLDTLVLMTREQWETQQEER